MIGDTSFGRRVEWQCLNSASTKPLQAPPIPSQILADASMVFSEDCYHWLLYGLIQTSKYKCNVSRCVNSTIKYVNRWTSPEPNFFSRDPSTNTTGARPTVRHDGLSCPSSLPPCPIVPPNNNRRGHSRRIVAPYLPPETVE